MMCLENLSKKAWITSCGTIKGSSIVKFLKMIVSIIKSIISRCLYVLYTFLAVWRVTEALDQSIYWLLLLCLCPLGIEIIHTVFMRQGKEMKWITPSVFFYMMGGIPCIWLLELKLLNDRISNGTTATTPNNAQTSIIAIPELPDESWTLALEQILIFVLVFAKWIAPKGEQSRSELSQLLLVNIAAGADIIELLEVFGEDEVSTNIEIVYLVMAVWSWSLLQFAVVLTATKNLPPLDEDYDEIIIGGTRINTLKNQDSQPNDYANNNKPTVQITDEKNNSGKQLQKKTKIRKKQNGKEKLAKDEAPRNGESSKKFSKAEDTISKPTAKPKEHHIEVSDEAHIVENHKNRYQVHDKLRANEEVAACLSGRRCFDYFCCYNEIWGMLLSIIFQDGPFFIIRMVILFYYKVVTHMNIFFTCKNVLVIMLLVNRIRVIILEERRGWLAYMKAVETKRRREKDESRRRLGLPPKTKETDQDVERARRRQSSITPIDNERNLLKPISTSKPRWMIWRA